MLLEYLLTPTHSSLLPHSLTAPQRRRAARASEAPRGGAAAGTAARRRRAPHASPMPPACHPTPSACSPMPPTCNHTRPGTAARRPGHGHLQPRPAAQRSGLEHRRATALLRRSGLGFVRRDGERSHSASKQARVGKVRAHLPTHLLTYLGNGARLRSCRRCRALEPFQTLLKAEQRFEHDGCVNAYGCAWKGELVRTIVLTPLYTRHDLGAELSLCRGRDAGPLLVREANFRVVSVS